MITLTGDDIDSGDNIDNARCSYVKKKKKLNGESQCEMVLFNRSKSYC
jgi:hypothetical protein